MAISRTRLRTLNKWVDANSEKEISTLYIEVDKSGCSFRAKGDKDYLLTGMIAVIVDLAVQGGISSEEITGKITGMIAERQRKDPRREELEELVRSMLKDLGTKGNKSGRLNNND